MAIKNAGSDPVNLLNDVTVERDIKLHQFHCCSYGNEKN